jgi:Tfp pilus assembly protein PilX
MIGQPLPRVPVAATLRTSFRCDQQGSALLVALFVITVVAALGVIGIRLGGIQTHMASLELDGHRAELAASAGIEAFAHRIANRAPAAATPPCPGTPVNIAIGDSAGNGAFVVRLVSCTRIVSGAVPNEQAVYDIAASAQRGAFGQPNFVQRTVMRRISTIGAGAY